MKYSAQLSEMIDVAIKKYLKSQFIFLTLTCKNHEDDELKELISKITRAFNLMTKSRRKIF